jgi:TetR/AcrR family transcriptional repressor of lmrAB and yxaGH operons
MSESKDKMTRAAIKLLRRSGLSGAGINQVIAESGAPKGSLYYYFPRGKSDLVEAALQSFGAAVRENFASVVSRNGSAQAKLQRLFESAAGRLQENRFSEGCAVAAVVLDLDEESTGFARTCREIFHGWQQAIAAGLTELDAKDRDRFAQFVIAALEGALILSRAERSTEPLMNVGRMLGQFAAMKLRKPARK